MNPTIETARLTLAPLSDRHAEGLHEAFGDPEAMRFWDAPPAVDVLQTAARIGRSLSAPSSLHAAWCLLRRSDEAVVGMINYNNRHVGHRRLHLGWITVPRHQRQGLMAEAAASVMAHCFEALDANRIEALIAPQNAASAALALRLGMRCEAALLRDYMLIDGVFQDASLYALLKHDWLGAHDAL